LLLALRDLENEGITFDIHYSRGPFFLRGTQEDINRWYASMGLPNDATRWKVAEVRSMVSQDAQIGALFDQAGLSPRNHKVTETKIWTETMTAHRLSQYAASEGSDKSELFWRALSRRWFEGKDTDILPLRLNNKDLLMECAEYAGLDTKKTRQVLDSDEFHDEVLEMIDGVHDAGFNAIPILVFEVDGLAHG
jgi:predicted DsbA family dithiol-disulfide isomerase